MLININSKSIYILFFVFLIITVALSTIHCNKPVNSFTVLSFNITPSLVLEGQKFNVDAEIRNDSDEAKTFEVPVMVNRFGEDRKFVTLDPGATQIIEFSLRRDNAGIYTVSIGSQSSTVEVREPIPPTFKLSNLKIKPDETTVNDIVVITADIENNGEILGQYNAELKINGVTAQIYELNLPPGVSSFAVFKVETDSPGIYEIAIGELTGQFIVLAPFIPIQVSPTDCPPSTKWDPAKKC